MSLPHPHYQYIREFDFIYPIIFQTFNIQRMWPLLSPVCPQFILRSIKLPTPRHTVSHNQQCVWSTRPHWMISNRWATPQRAIHQINYPTMIVQRRHSLRPAHRPYHNIRQARICMVLRAALIIRRPPPNNRNIQSLIIHRRHRRYFITQIKPVTMTISHIINAKSLEN